VEADLATIPLWLRDGAVVPLAPDREFIDEKPLKTMTLRIAPRAGDGFSELVIPAPQGDLRVSYRSTGDRHLVTTSPLADFKVKVVGPETVVVEHRPATGTD
jgi:alpha-glucosidase (family GH31 glycosyl hydrolase)